jgi:hypothetical protein
MDIPCLKKGLWDFAKEARRREECLSIASTDAGFWVGEVEFIHASGNADIE